MYKENLYSLEGKQERERVGGRDWRERREKRERKNDPERKQIWEIILLWGTERINSVSAISLVSTLSQSFLNPSFSNFYLWLLCYTFTSFFLSCLFILVRIGFFLHGTKKKKKTSTWHRIVNIVQIEWKLGWTGKVKSTGIYLRGRK